MSNRKKKWPVNKSRNKTGKSSARQGAPRRVNGLVNLSRSVARALGNTLDNPFRYGPVRNCYGGAPTALFTMYARYTAALSSVGGNGGIFLALYSTVSAINVSVASATNVTPTGSATAFPQLSTAQSQISTARVISAGIHWRARLAATDRGGKVRAGNMPNTSGTAFSALTYDAMVNHSSSVADYDNGWVGWRPLTLQNYANFTTNGISSDGVSAGNTVPYVVFVGFPANTIVDYEVIANYEGNINPSIVSIFPNLIGSGTVAGTYCIPDDAAAEALALAGQDGVRAGMAEQVKKPHYASNFRGGPALRFGGSAAGFRSAEFRPTTHPNQGEFDEKESAPDDPHLPLNIRRRESNPYVPPHAHPTNPGPGLQLPY